MGLSRRQFTKEFKLAAVRRLEQGVPIAEVARALEVSPNVLHRWRREFRHGPGNAFPGNGKPRWSEGESRNWNVKSVNKPWRSIF
jgi:transposase-like protein